jgi:hypothetical protein
MKPIRTALFALCLAATTIATQAQTTDQPTPPPQGRHGHGPPGLDINKLTVLLDLDTYQVQQVQQALTAQRTAMQTARQNDKAAGTRPSFQEMQARRTQMEQDLLSTLSTSLNPSQITKLKVLLEPPHGGYGPPGGATGAGTTNSTTNGGTAK